jgi:hypothetical protein
MFCKKIRFGKDKGKYDHSAYTEYKWKDLQLTLSINGWSLAHPVYERNGS